MLIPLCWAAFIFFLHSIPGFDLRYSDPWAILKFDKLAHMFLFAVLVVSCIVAFRKQIMIRSLRAYPRTWALGIALLYGGVLEFLQGQIFFQRFSDPVDFLANALGACIGLLLFRLIYGRELSRLV